MTVSVRLATEEDRNSIAEVVAEAFVHDPVYSYFASLKEQIPKDRETKQKKNLRKWGRFLLHSCIASGGRVTVLVEHSSGGGERIVAMAQWFPPNKRLALWHVKTLFNAGIVGMLRKWGLAGLLRCGFEWLDGSEQVAKKGFRVKGLGNPDESWYLQEIAVLPECQGKGYMSKLIREGFDMAPNDMFSLEATTPESRDKYAHLGFEVVGTITLGKGKSSAQGIATTGVSAVGVEAYSMALVRAGTERT